MTTRSLVPEDLPSLVRRLSPARAAASRDEWLKIGMAIHDVDPSDAGFQLFDDFSRQAPEKYNAADARGAWRSFTHQPGGVTVATLIRYANEDDPSGAQRRTTPAAPHATKRAYRGLDDYATAHNASVDAFIAAGWSKRPEWISDSRGQRRQALCFKTASGPRWRFIDGSEPPYHSPRGYRRCWYLLDEAIVLAQRTGQSLVIVNGEASAVAAQAHGIAATAVAGGSEKSRLPDELLDELRAKWSTS